MRSEVRVLPRPPCRGSSVVEQGPEEPRVGCSIHPLGTTKIPSFDGFFVLVNQKRARLGSFYLRVLTTTICLIHRLNDCNVPSD